MRSKHFKMERVLANQKRDFSYIAQQEKGSELYVAGAIGGLLGRTKTLCQKSILNI